MSGRAVIRRGTEADAAAVAELHLASLRSSYAAYLPAEALADGQLLGRAEQWRELWPLRLGIDYGAPGQQPVLLLAEAAGELLGFAYLTPEGDGRVLLDNLHVRPGRTGRGLGARLLHAARAEAGPGALHLDVLAANVRAVAFYEREGGVRTAERSTVLADGSEAAECEYTWPSAR
ncbi:GNAT family N-acetyltransferase [Kitasatospora sp. NPDC002227]|uniref:GNAT family N-acetyltransferase n=1 Tax=Kitasatospora sp. NPDC002227 TaxID=3154773 RepID=UPI00332A3C76